MHLQNTWPSYFCRLQMQLGFYLPPRSASNLKIDWKHFAEHKISLLYTDSNNEAIRNHCPESEDFNFMKRQKRQVTPVVWHKSFVPFN